MNIWEHKYPNTIDEMIAKSNCLISVLKDKLNDSSCKKLGELYFINKNQKVKRNQRAFNDLNYKPNTHFNDKSKQEDEISGIYVFGEEDQETKKIIPIYVGISRTIYRRLKQHGWGTLHNQATLAFLKFAKKTDYKGQRKYITTTHLLPQQEIIRNYKVAILPEKEYYNMYFMEVYFAGVWKTKWNSFKTH